MSFIYTHTPEEISALESAIASQTSVVAQAQGILDAMNLALTLLKDGYQSDAQAIATGIAEGKAAAVAILQG